MLICIAGKNDIAVNAINYLYQKGYNNAPYTLGVLCNKNDIGKDSWQKSLKKCARELGIKEYILEELYHLKDLVFISLEYDKIINIDRFRSRKLYNIHFSLLPKYKGMYTSAWPILNNESKSGVTLHKIDSGIDTGEIIDQLDFEIGKQDTARDLYFKYLKKGEDLFKKNIKMLIENDNISSIKQSLDNSTYYSKKTIDYGNLSIDINKTAYEIQTQLRAFTFREFQVPKILGRHIIKSEIISENSKLKAGNIIEECDEYLILSTIDYNIKLYKELIK